MKNKITIFVLTILSANSIKCAYYKDENFVTFLKKTMTTERKETIRLFDKFEKFDDFNKNLYYRWQLGEENFLLAEHLQEGTPDSSNVTLSKK